MLTEYEYKAFPAICVVGTLFVFVFLRLLMMPVSAFAATTVDGVITLSGSDLTNGASGTGWSFDRDILTFESGYTLDFGGTCGYYVTNNGTIIGGIFEGLGNAGLVTGNVGLSGTKRLADMGGKYGKDVKPPKAAIRGTITYTGEAPRSFS